MPGAATGSGQRIRRACCRRTLPCQASWLSSSGPPSSEPKVLVAGPGLGRPGGDHRRWGADGAGRHRCPAPPQRRTRARTPPTHDQADCTPHGAEDRSRRSVGGAGPREARQFVWFSLSSSAGWRRRCRSTAPSVCRWRWLRRSRPGTDPTGRLGWCRPAGGPLLVGAALQVHRMTLVPGVVSPPPASRHRPSVVSALPLSRSCGRRRNTRRAKRPLPGSRSASAARLRSRRASVGPQWGPVRAVPTSGRWFPRAGGVRAHRPPQAHRARAGRAAEDDEQEQAAAAPAPCRAREASIRRPSASTATVLPATGRDRFSCACTPIWVAGSRTSRQARFRSRLPSMAVP